ncbi:MAG: tripartite tricarboxylate transporter family receptor [Hyphomicrobiales bacterium]|nr:tripartite tricarboxylate transporter family receptor [Hyphomicrobiales bacterium]
MLKAAFRVAIGFCAVMATSMASIGASAAAEQSVEDFYRANKLVLIVGVSAGGGYDLNARLLARYIGRHIPGNPAVVVQNMPGSGSVIAAGYLYSIAPKDGSVIGTLARIALMEPLFTPQKFDSTKFVSLGSISKDISTCISWKTSKVKTWDDMMTKEFIASGQGTGADPDAFANMIHNLFGAPIRLVTGYPGTNEQALSMERGETEGYCGISYSTIKTRYAKWLAEKSINVIVQNAVEKHPDLPNVPLITELAKNPEQLQIIRLIVATQSMARPFFAPPGIPADRAAALRRAFDLTMADPEFLAEAERTNIDVSPMNGADAQALLTELYATPKSAVEKAARAMSSSP